MSPFGVSPLPDVQKVVLKSSDIRGTIAATPTRDHQAHEPGKIVLKPFIINGKIVVEDLIDKASTLWIHHNETAVERFCQYHRPERLAE